MNLVLATPPSTAEILNIVSVAELKAEQRVTHSLEDAAIQAAIEDAYGFLDGRNGWLNRSILTQTWKLYLPAFADRMELPFPPLSSVTQVRYRDTANAWQVLDTSVYVVVAGEFVPYLALADGQSWPETYVHPEAVEATYVAGYGLGAAVKAGAFGIRRGIKLLAGHFYRNREATLAEPRMVTLSRRLELGLEEVAGMFRIPNSHA
jgi:uncharacterized phiE125 gp8 family phage protein